LHYRKTQQNSPGSVTTLYRCNAMNNRGAGHLDFDIAASGPASEFSNTI
jgi:hypothetical protein